jgi:biopolymer transport protein ExbB
LLRVFLWHASSNTTQLVDEVVPYLQKGEMKNALNVCQPAKGAASRVLAATIRHIDSEADHLEDIISESILHETPYLERFESAITVFAAVAPLLGLLGTVTGMISTFDVITEYGTGDPKLLSGGISEALVTTQLGLMVAIPTLLLGNLFSGWAERIKAGMESAALQVTNITKDVHPVATGR